MLVKQNPHHYAILDRANLAGTTKRQYKQAIDRLILAGVDPRDRAALSIYAGALPNSSRAFLKSALRVLFENQVTELKAQARPENVQNIQALLYNIEAMNDAIRVHTPKGKKSHLWLTSEQIGSLTNTDNLRDWLVLALLLHGLRRDEAVNLTFDRIKTLPTHDGRNRYIVDVTGKGAKDRTVPISTELFDSIVEWHKRVGAGFILRSIDRHGNINHSLTGQGVMDIVGKYGAQIGLPELEPHDLRRSYAMAIWEQTRDILLVMTRLGHSDPKVTIRYLDLDSFLDIETVIQTSKPPQ